MRCKNIFLFIFCFSFFIVHENLYAQSKTQNITVQPSSTKHLRHQLKKNNFPTHFTERLLKNYNSKQKDYVIRLNVMGFLSTANYNGHLSNEALEQCRKFLNEYATVFTKAENRFGVKREIIAALLWVESRLGENHGKFNVANVYLSLIQSDHPDNFQMLKEDLKSKLGKPKKKDIKKVKVRSKTKVRWAIDELWSLYKMSKSHPKIIETLNGSYSGAFGMSQFLPSSYLSWAVSYDKNSKPDLYNPPDAIFSVANYLKKNGYKKNKPKSYKKALYHYNKSHDYGAIILKIADQL